MNDPSGLPLLLGARSCSICNMPGGHTAVSTTCLHREPAPASQPLPPSQSFSALLTQRHSTQKPLQGKPGQGGGLFLSPYGVAQALGMLLNGVAPGGDSFRQLQASRDFLSCAACGNGCWRPVLARAAPSPAPGSQAGNLRRSLLRLLFTALLFTAPTPSLAPAPFSVQLAADRLCYSHHLPLTLAPLLLLQSVVFGGAASDGDSLEGLNLKLMGLSQALVKVQWGHAKRCSPALTTLSCWWRGHACAQHTWMGGWAGRLGSTVPCPCNCENRTAHGHSRGLTCHLQALQLACCWAAFSHAAPCLFTRYSLRPTT